jgi:tetratricopeptide (TPR) repeat protein
MKSNSNGRDILAKISSLLLSGALAAAVCIGSQTRQWSWGPCLFILGIALLALLPEAVRAHRSLGVFLTSICLTTVGWFTWRASVSPVGEFAMSDFLLLLAAVGGFLAANLVFRSPKRASFFLWGLCILVASSVAVSVVQHFDPHFTPIFLGRPYSFPSGFFGHYNECANFLLGASPLLGSFAVLGKSSLPTRLVWGLSALAGLAGVYISNSRGAILSAAIAAVIWWIMILVCCNRRIRWFTPVAFATPLLILAACGFLWKGWQSAQQARVNPDAPSELTKPLVASVLDNSVRLSLLQIAAESIAQTPLSGGGSRSFSWNCYFYWDMETHGMIVSRPEVVHNEILQAATDYGLIGAGLLLLIIATLVTTATVRVLLPGLSFWEFAPATVGGFAGLAGMFIQSCFSPVFHLIPGALLLGICLGALGISSLSESVGIGGRFSRTVIILTMIATAIAGIASGIPRSGMTVILWNCYFKGGSPLLPREIVNRLEEASHLIQLPSVTAEKAMILFRLSRSNDPLASDAEEDAITAFYNSLSGNPKNPTATLILAHLLGNAGRHDEAEEQYRRTIQLQGNAESLFWGHLRLAEYFVRKGALELRTNRAEQAILSLESALVEISASERFVPWVTKMANGIDVSYSANENLGFALELTGDLEGAIQYYTNAAAIRGSANYHLGRLLESIGRTYWKERKPSQALWQLQKAAEVLKLVNGLPSGVTTEDVVQRRNDIDESIQFLLGAGIEPLER